MNTNESTSPAAGRPKLIATTALLLLGGSMGWHLYRNTEELEQLEQLTAARSATQDMRASLNTAEQALMQARTESHALESKVQEQQARANAAEQRAAADRTSVEALSAARAELRAIRKQLAEAQATGSSAASQLADLRAQLDAAIASNDGLERRNSDMQKELERLAMNNAFIDESLTEAYRGRKEKLTVLARKARKLQLSMALPPAVAQNAQFKLTTPTGEVLQNDAPGMSVIHRSSDQRTASAGGTGKVPMREEVKLVYLPKKRLKAGMYKLEVHTPDGPIGTSYLHLR